MQNQSRRQFLVRLKGLSQGLLPADMCVCGPQLANDLSSLIADRIAGAQIWLRSGQVTAFDPYDFDDLTADQISHANDLIQLYESIAIQRIDDSLPRPEVMKRAKNALLELLQIFSKALKSLERPY